MRQPYRTSSQDFLSLPQNLPVPQDDGACDHLTGLHVPPITLGLTGPAVLESEGSDLTCLPRKNLLDLGQLPSRTVIFNYPRTGEPRRATPPGWDEIAGARGCTPHCCGFRDLAAAFAAEGYALFGLSTQSPQFHVELSRRLSLSYSLLSDQYLILTRALQLPYFVFEELDAGDPENPVLLKRMVWVIHDGRIIKVFYPVFPPGQSAQTVLDWIRRPASQAVVNDRRRHSVHEVRGKLLLSNAAELLQPERVRELLAQTHWAQGRSVARITVSLRNSESYGIYERDNNHRQIGVARVVTDHATFAYLCDVVIDTAYRGQGLSKWLMSAIMANPDVAQLKRFLLVTKDAHGLYEQYGFLPLPADRALRFMEILRPDA